MMENEHKQHNKNDESMNERGKRHAGHMPMVADFKRRFLISCILTIPVLALSPMIQEFVGLKHVLRFPGYIQVLFGFSSIIYFYGGWPFLRGMWKECSTKKLGMMTLVATAITTAYVYSSAIVFGLQGKMFFWELVTLIDIMLLGHWIEMKSVMGAGRALTELASLIPDSAHLLREGGSLEEVSVDVLKNGDFLLVKPGERQKWRECCTSTTPSQKWR